MNLVTQQAGRFHIIPAESVKSVEPENVLTEAESKVEITKVSVFQNLGFGCRYRRDLPNRRSQDEAYASIPDDR
jgi:hypothetical protein